MHIPSRGSVDRKKRRDAISRWFDKLERRLAKTRELVKLVKSERNQGPAISKRALSRIREVRLVKKGKDRIQKGDKEAAGAS